MTSNGFEQDIRHSETPTDYERKTAVTRHSIVKCPSKVRHKTFGVQFIAIMPFYSRFVSFGKFHRLCHKNIIRLANPYIDFP